MNVIFYLCLFTFLVCDNGCGECDFAANDCTSCPDGKNLDSSGDLWSCNSGDSGFNILDHPWWIVLIVVFLVAVVIAAYFMFRDKKDDDGNEY